MKLFLGLLLGLVLLFASCGGRGGGGPVRPPVPPPPPPVEPEPEPEPPVEPPPQPDLPTANDFAKHPEYIANWALAAVGAAPAYARLAQRRGAEAPGTGVTIGVLDSGIYLDHWEFDPDKVSETIFSGDGGDRNHGTAVASVIAAQRDNSIPDSIPPDHWTHEYNFHGIAWGAQVDMYSIPLGSGGGLYEPVNLEELGSSGDGFAITEDDDVDLGTDPDILNMSFGYHGLIENYEEYDLRRYLSELIAALAQSDRTEKMLITIAAGNGHGWECKQGTDNCIGATLFQTGTIDATSPEGFAGLPARIPELRSHLVAVVATNRQGTIANLSNRCGIAAKWCLAAPGKDVLHAYYEVVSEDETLWGYNFHSGTSFAAPLVAGGLAVMKHYFRDQLPNTDLLNRLYVTADVTPDDVTDHGGQCPAHLDTNGDLSACELSSTLGRGLMDLDAATRPVGETSIMLGSTLSGPQVAAGTSFLATGGAMGDAVSSTLRGRELAVFDELGAPFWVGVDRVQGRANAGLGTRLARFLAAPAPGGGVSPPFLAGSLMEMPLAATRLRLGSSLASGEHVWTGGHASLVPVERGGASVTLDGGALEFSAFASGSEFSDVRGGRDRNSATGAVLGWKLPGTPLGLRVGTIREYDSALGTMGRGAFGQLAAEVAYAGMRFDTGVGGWLLSGEAELGTTGARATRGLMRDISRLGTTAFSVAGARNFKEGSWLRLSLSQPLRVEGGRMRLDIPVGRTKQGEVLRELVDVNAAPSGRSIDLAAEWIRPLVMGEVRLGTTVVLHPRHDAGRAPDLVLMAGYRLWF